MRYSCAHETMPLTEEKAVVLHQHRRLDAGQVRARRDADPFFFLREANQRHLGIVFRHPNQMHQPGFRQRRHEPDARGLERVVDDS